MVLLREPEPAADHLGGQGPGELAREVGRAAVGEPVDQPDDGLADDGLEARLDLAGLERGVEHGADPFVVGRVDAGEVAGRLEQLGSRCRGRSRPPRRSSRSPSRARRSGRRRTGRTPRCRARRRGRAAPRPAGGGRSGMGRRARRADPSAAGRRRCETTNVSTIGPTSSANACMAHGTTAPAFGQRRCKAWLQRAGVPSAHGELGLGAPHDATATRRVAQGADDAGHRAGVLGPLPHGVPAQCRGRRRRARGQVRGWTGLHDLPLVAGLSVAIRSGGWSGPVRRCNGSATSAGAAWMEFPTGNREHRRDARGGE